MGKTLDEVMEQAVSGFKETVEQQMIASACRDVIEMLAEAMASGTAADARAVCLRAALLGAAMEVLDATIMEASAKTVLTPVEVMRMQVSVAADYDDMRRIGRLTGQKLSDRLRADLPHLFGDSPKETPQ